ncbi:beta-1,3-galactosyltransferase GALT1 [Tanacetum coccineum]
MFKLEDVAMGIWIADLKKNGLEVRYDQEEGVYNEGCKDGYVVAHYQGPQEILCLWQKLQEEMSLSGGQCNILLLQLDTGFFDLVFVVDISIVVEDSMTWICGRCGGVGDSSSSSFEILIIGIGPLLLSGTKIHKFLM